ncbi:hypothetical protein ACLOJK_036049 [Asimina triloba]
MYYSAVTTHPNAYALLSGASCKGRMILGWHISLAKRAKRMQQAFLRPLTIRPWRRISTVRSFSLSASSNRSRGGLPRFYSEKLPPSKGNITRVQGDEFWHMTKVLRLNVNDRVELFNGTGGVIEGFIQRIDRTGLDFMALEDPKVLSPTGIQWHVYAAFGTLKGGRADWLVEKCTELGASSITPLLTERSSSITENRVDRLQRVALAAVKQCQRLHEMTLNPPMKIGNLLPIVAQSKLAFLAAAEATPLLNTLSFSGKESDGLIIVGPEGGSVWEEEYMLIDMDGGIFADVDFTEREVQLMTEAGATVVGLGPCRLRVETATIALLIDVFGSVKRLVFPSGTLASKFSHRASAMSAILSLMMANGNL